MIIKKILPTSPPAIHFVSYILSCVFGTFLAGLCILISDYSNNFPSVSIYTLKKALISLLSLTLYASIFSIVIALPSYLICIIFLIKRKITSLYKFALGGMITSSPLAIFFFYVSNKDNLLYSMIIPLFITLFGAMSGVVYNLLYKKFLLRMRQ